MSPDLLLEARDMCAGYGGVEIVRNLSLKVFPGEVVALLGANGAGKTTTMLTLAGELKPLGGEILLKGLPTTAPLHKRARDGMAFVTEERSVFINLTTKQNLAVAHADISKATTIFPELEALLSRRGGLLSGGEQQMLTLGRALSRQTDLLLADESRSGLLPRPLDDYCVPCGPLPMRVSVHCSWSSTFTECSRLPTAYICFTRERSSSRARQTRHVQTSTRSRPRIWPRARPNRLRRLTRR